MLDLLLAIRNHACVTEIEIMEIIDESELKYLRAKAFLSDGSVLHIREVITPTDDKYSYHWQSAEGSLHRRWDNAPHWRNITTFPHHLHVECEENVEQSSRVTIMDVLDWIHEHPDV